MLNRTYNAVKNYLSENLKEALDLAEQMDLEDDSFEWARVWDWEELCEIAAQGGKDAVDELVRGAINGQTYGGRVRYDGWGNVVPGEEEDLLADALSYLDDIMNGLKNYIDDDGYVKYLVVSYELQETINNSRIVKFNITDIVYDITEEDCLTEEEINEMPKEVTVELIPNEDEIDESELKDMVTDTIRWDVLSFKYQYVEEEGVKEYSEKE